MIKTVVADKYDKVIDGIDITMTCSRTRRLVDGCESHYLYIVPDRRDVKVSRFQ